MPLRAPGCGQAVFTAHWAQRFAGLFALQEPGLVRMRLGVMPQPGNLAYDLEAGHGIAHATGAWGNPVGARLHTMAGAVWRYAHKVQVGFQVGGERREEQERARCKARAAITDVMRLFAVRGPSATAVLALMADMLASCDVEEPRTMKTPVSLMGGEFRVHEVMLLTAAQAAFAQSRVLLAALRVRAGLRRSAMSRRLKEPVSMENIVENEGQGASARCAAVLQSGSNIANAARKSGTPYGEGTA